MTRFKKQIVVLIFLYFLFFAFATGLYFYFGRISSSELGIDSKQIPQWSRNDIIAIFAAIGALMAPIAVLFGLHDWKRQQLISEKLKLLYEIHQLNGEIKGIIDDIRNEKFYMQINLANHEKFEKYFKEYYVAVNHISMKIHSLSLIDVDGDFKRVKDILVIFDIITKNFYESYNYFRNPESTQNKSSADLHDLHALMLSSDAVRISGNDPKKIINEVEKRYKSHFDDIDKILKKAVSNI